MDNLIALRQIDRQLLPLKTQAAHLMPAQGWVRTIRKALGMTLKQLAARLGVGTSRVVKIEMSEVEGAVTLRTLQSVAEAFDCTLVYGFVPKSSLENTIKHQAKKVAVEQIKRTAHTMTLEAQPVKQSWLDQQTKDLETELLRKSWKHLWGE